MARARPAPSPAPVCGRPESSPFAPFSRSLGRVRMRRSCRAAALQPRRRANERAAYRCCGRCGPMRRVTGGRTRGVILRGTWAVRPCGHPAQKSESAVCSRPTEVVWLAAAAREFPSPGTRWCWAEPSRVRRCAEACRQSRPPQASFVFEAIDRGKPALHPQLPAHSSFNLRSRGSCERRSSSSLAAPACADVAGGTRTGRTVTGRSSFQRVLRTSAFSLPGTWCGDALRALLKSLHGRIAHAASSFTRGTPDMRLTHVFRVSSGGGRSRFRLHPLLFRCHPRDALRTSTLAWEEYALVNRGAQQERKPVLWVSCGGIGIIVGGGGKRGRNQQSVAR